MLYSLKFGKNIGRLLGWNVHLVTVQPFVLLFFKFFDFVAEIDLAPCNFCIFFLSDVRRLIIIVFITF